MTGIVTQWKNAFYLKCVMQTLGQIATDNDTEYYSLREHLILIVKD